MIDLTALSDGELESRLKTLVAQERERTVEVIACLAEIHRRHLELERGYSGLFYYCTKTLGYTPDQAMRRITAARLAVKVPKIIDKLDEGSLTVSAIRVLSPILDDSNRDVLLEKASGLTLGEVERLAAGFNAERAAPDRIRIVRPARSEAADDLPLFAIETPKGAAASRVEEPLRVNIGFSGSEELLKKIERAKQLLWHSFPDGRLEDVIGQALEDLLERRDPDRRKEPPRKPKLSTGAEHSRYIPLWVRADVWKRDGGRCAFATDDGVRCEEQSGLEYDHIVPWSMGGPSDDPSNLRLLCRAHNQLAARKCGLTSRFDRAT